MSDFKKRLYDAIQEVSDEWHALSHDEFRAKINGYLENERAKAILLAWNYEEQESTDCDYLPPAHEPIGLSEILGVEWEEVAFEFARKEIKLEYGDNNSSQQDRETQTDRSYKELTHSDDYVYEAAA